MTTKKSARYPRAPAKRTAKVAKTARATWVRKNMAMDQRKLSLVKQYLGVNTETEAVDAALDLVAFKAEVLAGLDALAAAQPIRDIYRRSR